MPNPNKIFVKKASGEIEPFNPEKVINSLKRVGANKSEIKEVLKVLYKNLYPKITTKEIYAIVFNTLRGLNKKGGTVANKYSLKKAIAQLGPTGYPFEKFFAGLLTELKFKTQTNVIIPGKCVNHEIDILAKKNNKTIFIEAKFHKKQGYKTDIKTALYVYARYLDLKEINGKNTEMWLITNTKVTEEVKKFSRCRKFKVVSWDYPSGFSLREIIDKSHLHPITALASLDSFTKENLLNNGVVFCKDIKRSQNMFRNQRLYNKALEEAQSLCGKSEKELNTPKS